MCRVGTPYREGLRAVGGVVLHVALLLAASCGQSTTEPEEPRIGRYPASHFLIRHDLFLPTTDPGTIPATAAPWLKPEDEVFGLMIGDQARAYPITMLGYHHVVNDSIGKSPFAVTY